MSGYVIVIHALLVLLDIAKNYHIVQDARIRKEKRMLSVMGLRYGKNAIYVKLDIT